MVHVSEAFLKSSCST